MAMSGHGYSAIKDNSRWIGHFKEVNPEELFEHCKDWGRPIRPRRRILQNSKGFLKAKLILQVRRTLVGQSRIKELFEKNMRKLSEI